MRAEIEQAFDMHAVDIYGLSEVMGPGVAQECVETKDGLHLWEDHFYPEIIDPATGEVLPDGEMGELVFTTLTKEGLPIIRYRTRDLTRLLPGTARSMRRIEKITGRSDDMIILRGVNIFPTQVEEQILKCTGLAPHFQIELTRTGRMDEMTIHAECTPNAATEMRPSASTRELAQHVKSTLGVTARVIVHAPGGAPRSEGKAKRVVDNRPEGGLTWPARARMISRRNNAPSCARRRRFLPKGDGQGVHGTDRGARRCVQGAAVSLLPRQGRADLRHHPHPSDGTRRRHCRRRGCQPAPAGPTARAGSRGAGTIPRCR